MVKVFHLRKSRKDGDYMSKRRPKSHCEFNQTVCILLMPSVLESNQYFLVVADKLHLFLWYWCTSTL